MSGFVEGIDRSQSSLFPAELEDYVAEDNPVRAVDAFVEGLDLGKLGFGRVAALERGRPCYHSATLLKIYIYGYLNRVPSSRRLERECQRNIELIWLTGHLAPDFKTIADFRKDNGKAIREVCRSFVAVCRELDLLSEGSVAIDGSKFKAVNARDKNFTEAKMKRRLPPSKGPRREQRYRGRDPNISHGHFALGLMTGRNPESDPPPRPDREGSQGGWSKRRNESAAIYCH